MSVQMQAQLKTSEFSYLLHTMGAQQVVGVHNESLFPSDEATKEALLAQGFADLQTDEWLVPQNGTFQTNADLMLLVAVIAAPESVIMMTKAMPNKQRQTITYYQAQGIIVEQFYTSENQYLLTRFEAIADIVERLTQAMEIPVQESPKSLVISLKTKAFEQALEQAASGDLSALTNLVSTSNLPENEVDQIALSISRMQAVGNIEITAFSSEEIRILSNIIVLKNEALVWAIWPGSQTGTLQLQLVDDASFSRLILTILNS